MTRIIQRHGRFTTVTLEGLEMPRRRAWCWVSIHLTAELRALLALVGVLAVCWLAVQLRMGGV